MIPAIVTALRAVSKPRFFETERGYQGEFLAELRAALPALGPPGDIIVEQEYQKTLPRHNINIRPDIIVHVPTADGATAPSSEGRDDRHAQAARNPSSPDTPATVRSKSRRSPASPVEAFSASNVNRR